MTNVWRWPCDCTGPSEDAVTQDRRRGKHRKRTAVSESTAQRVCTMNFKFTSAPVHALACSASLLPSLALAQAGGTLVFTGASQAVPTLGEAMMGATSLLLLVMAARGLRTRGSGRSAAWAVLSAAIGLGSFCADRFMQRVEATPVATPITNCIQQSFTIADALPHNYVNNCPNSMTGTVTFNPLNTLGGGSTCVGVIQPNANCTITFNWQG